MDEVESIYYVRFMVLDRPGVLSQISGVFGRQNISIASVIQRGRKQGGAVPLVIMTHTARERDMRQALGGIRALDTVTEEPVLIRVEGEDKL
jgi:homoserine dehydrogenase